MAFENQNTEPICRVLIIQPQINLEPKDKFVSLLFYPYSGVGPLTDRTKSCEPQVSLGPVRLSLRTHFLTCLVWVS